MTRERPWGGRLHLGAAYYFEYAAPGAVPDARSLARDLDRMVAAGITLIRVGESVWSTWEPRDGEFDLEWLAPVLDAAHERGIAVVLGTPTYALPMWLAAKHPELAGESATGRRIGWGGRQEMDFTHPVFRAHAERVIRAVVGRYAVHPAIVGYQVDNEPGLRILFNDTIFGAFRDHLTATYGTVDALNEAWGLTYWSHRLSDWAELWRPDDNRQPQYELAWRRFQARLVDDYIAWQAGLVREIVGTGPEAPFVTTCISYEQAAVDDATLSRSLDLASCNAYYTPQEALTVPSDVALSPDWIVDGTWGAYELADLAYSSKQAEFWVTETNAGGIGQNAYNLPPYDGQLRQIAWALVSRGARAVEYWHWHTLHHGAETYWIGLVPHDGEPGRILAEVSRIGAEFAAAGATFDGARPDADVAFLYSSDSKWALGSYGLSQPLGADRHGANPDAYRQLALPFYRAAFDAGLQVSIVRPQQLDSDAADFARARRVLVVSGAFVLDDARLEWLLAYAEAGGHLVLGPRAAYGDDEARARLDRKPARLAAAAGVSYQEFQSLAEPVALVGGGSGPRLGDGATGSRWAEYLEADGADVLARYDGPHLGRFAAITSREVGAGRITMAGTVPDQATLAGLLAWAAGPSDAAWQSDDPSVRFTSTRLADGRRAWFVHHWAWGSAAATAASSMTDLVSGERIDAGRSVALGPWDVRVLIEEPHPN